MIRTNVMEVDIKFELHVKLTKFCITSTYTLINSNDVRNTLIVFMTSFLICFPFILFVFGSICS